MDIVHRGARLPQLVADHPSVAGLSLVGLASLNAPFRRRIPIRCRPGRVRGRCHFFTLSLACFIELRGGFVEHEGEARRP